MMEKQSPKGKSREALKRKKESKFEPIEDIRTAISDCSQLIDEGIITLELKYPYKVVFRIDEERFGKLSGWDDDRRKKFRRLLSQEVTFGLESALTHEPPLRGFMPFLRTPEERKEAEIIVEETRKVLVTPTLETWARLKHSSKDNVLQSFEWEINTKERDRHLGELSGMRYATVRLFYTRPSQLGNGEKFIFWSPFEKREERSITLNLHYKEVKELINDFTKILKVLEMGS